MNEHIRAPGGWASVSDRFPVVVGSRQAAAVRATGRVGLGRFSPGGRLGRMFTSRECNKHRVLRDGSGHIFAFVSSSNGCKRLVAVAPQIGRASCRERGKISVVAVSLKKRMSTSRKRTRECRSTCR